MEMKKYKLSEICDINHSSLKATDGIGEILYLDTSNITENTIAKLQHFQRKNAPSRAQRKVQDKTIIFSTVRPNQNHFGIMNQPKDNLIVSSGFTTLDVKNKNEFDANYVYLKLTQPIIVDYLQTLAQNSVSSYPSINPDDIGNLYFQFPSLQTQQKIATVLSTLDNKIALNHRINAKLEAMAKRLYDYWFVQFDFPNSEGNPYKSSGGKMVWNEVLKREIPEDWEVKRLGDYLKIGNGRDHSKLADGPYPVYGSGGVMRYVAEFLHDGATVLFPRKGTLNNVMYRNEPLWTVDTMFYTSALIPHSALFVFYSAKMFDFERLNTGTGVPSMTSDIIKKLPIISPDESILKQFDKTVSKVYNRIHHNEKEIKKLTDLRDRLLPLLMNGQVELK